MDILIAVLAFILSFVALKRGKSALKTLSDVGSELKSLKNTVDRLELLELAYLKKELVPPTQTAHEEVSHLSEEVTAVEEEREELCCSVCGARINYGDPTCAKCGVLLEYEDAVTEPEPELQTLIKPLVDEETLHEIYHETIASPSKPTADIVDQPGRQVGDQFDMTPRTSTARSGRSTSSRIAELEKKFAENWTGILGSVVMVLGVSFLGIYAALKLEPVYRFVLMMGFSSALWIIDLRLRRREPWIQFANWLGSSGAAIVLFACFGSGHIPGLQWIESPSVALALVVTGIIVNMYFALLGSSQVFISLHVILSLAALIVIPQDETLIIGAAVALGSILLSYRHQWDKHLLLAITAYCIFHLRWYFAEDLIGAPQRLIGVACAIAVGAAAAFMHYRKDYASATPRALPLSAHILNWLYAAFLLFLLSTESRFITIPLVIGAVAAYYLARHARTVGILWVYRCDTVISQVIGSFAVVSLGRWDINGYAILAILFFQSILFSFLMWVEKEKTLSNVSALFSHLVGVLFLATGIVRSLGSSGTLDTETLWTTVATLCVGLAIHWAILRKYGEEFGSLKHYFGNKDDVSFLGVVVGSALVIIAIGLRNHEWFGYEAPVIVMAMMFIGSALQSRGIKAGLLFSILCIHFTLLISLKYYDNPDSYHQLIGLGLMFAATCAYFSDHLWREWSYGLKTASLLLLLSELIFMATALGGRNANDPLVSFRSAGITAGIGGVGLIFHFFALKRKENFLNSVLGAGSQQAFVFGYGVLLGCFPAIVAAHLYLSPYSELVTFVLVGIMLVLRNRFQSDGLGIGVLVSIVAMHGMTWAVVLGHQEMDLGTKLLRLLPLFGVSLLAVRLSYAETIRSYVRWPGIYVAGIHAAMTVYLLTNPLSSLLPGVLWLLFSLAFLQASRLVPDPPEREYGHPARYLLHLGYLMIAAFLVRHFLYHLQVESYVGEVRLRLIVAMFALAVFLLWSLTQRKPEGVQYKSWTYLHPLFVELLIAFSAVTVAIEVDNLYLPLVWAVAAILLYIAGRKKTDPMSRLRFYALVFGWCSTISLVAVTSTIETPSKAFLQQPTLLGAIVLVLNVVFLAITERGKFLDQIQFPEALVRFSRTVEKFRVRKNIWIYYPFFLSTALFLFWRFDAQVLTLLWVAECFAVFALSILLRVPHFKTLSMAALGLCLVRLVVFDLAQSETLTRGIVFLGVGGIMIFMNYLYKRYKTTLEQ